MSVQKYSSLPWPNGCASSGGRSMRRRPTRSSVPSQASMNEWSPSDHGRAAADRGGDELGRGDHGVGGDRRVDRDVGLPGRRGGPGRSAIGGAGGFRRRIARARYGSLGALGGSRRHAVGKGNARAGREKPPGPRLPAIRGAFFRWRDSIRSVRRRACTRPDRLPLPSPLRSRLRCFRIRRSYSRGQRPRDRPVDAELPTGDSPLASHRRASRPRLTVPSNAAPTCTCPIGASIENFSRTRQPRAQRR